MALHIDPNAGTLTITKAGSNKATVLSLPELGWDFYRKHDPAGRPVAAR